MPEPERPVRSYKAGVRGSFDRQTLMSTIGARLSVVEPGRVVIDLPYRTDLCQQHGFLHAGILASILDTACGYAAMTLLPPGSDVLSVEFKINMLAPAKGSRFLARARVLRSGSGLTTCSADAFAMGGRSPTLVATLLATVLTRSAGARPSSSGRPRQQLLG
jgi:uncharacterized protein (TIGR00369 family)